MTEDKKIAARVAFTRTLPIFWGFLFLGSAYGMMMTGLGFAPWMPVLMSLLIDAGSVEFLVVSMLLSTFNPLSTAFMTLMVNGRHLFYGLSLIEPYRQAGPKAAYMIYTLSDEVYSLLVTLPPPKNAAVDWYMFFVSFFLQSFWVFGTAVGAFAGSLIRFDLPGIAYVMTALFVVLFMSQWREGRPLGPFKLTAGRRAALIGLVTGLVARLVFGPDQFMVPAMVLILVGLLTCRDWIEKGGQVSEP